MSATIVVLALLALAGFLFWLAERYDGFIIWFVAAGVLAWALYGASGVLS